MNEIPVLIPAYNPDEKLIRLVNGLSSASIPVVVIDDGSTGAANVFSKLENVDFVQHSENQGKGSAIKTGIDHVLKRYPDVLGVVTADADGQHVLKDIICVRNTLEMTKGFVLGSRKFTRVMPLKSKFGNALSSVLFWLHTRTWLCDTQTGLRGIPKSILLPMLELKGNRYDFETEMLIWIVRNHVPIKEVGIGAVYINENRCSHFRPIIDSMLIYGVFARYCVSSLLAFGVDNLVFVLISTILLERIKVDAAIFLAIVVARSVSSNVNYLCSKMVFKGAVTLSSYAKHYATVCVNSLIGYVLIDGFVRFVDTSAIETIATIKILVECIVFISSYLLQRHWVFKRND